jgi:hypothetical protein
MHTIATRFTEAFGKLDRNVNVAEEPHQATFRIGYPETVSLA